jgi:hypothetical protein
MIDNRTREQKFDDICSYNRQNKFTINLKNMKTTKKQKEISKKHYEKNKHIISERNKQNRKRQQRLDKIYFYGFWLLLTAVLVDTFINQILK